jgi:hypothetical protein
LKLATEPLGIDFVVFSDSIVLTAKGDDEASFLALAEACSRLLYDLLEKDIPLRGAIAFGDFVRRGDIAKSIFIAGRALIEAYRFEQAQNWIGIMLAPSVIRQLPLLAERCRLEEFANPPTPVSIKKIDPLWPRLIQRCAAIPFHEKRGSEPSDFSGFAIVPTSGTFEPSSNSSGVSEAIRRLRWLESLAPTPADQYKYRHTLVWLSRICSCWMMVENERGVDARRRQ